MPTRKQTSNETTAASDPVNVDLAPAVVAEDPPAQPVAPPEDPNQDLVASTADAIAPTTGEDYVRQIVARGYLPALCEIAERAAELIAVGIPATSEDQARAASALQRAVLNLPR